LQLFRCFSLVGLVCRYGGDICSNQLIARA